MSLIAGDEQAQALRQTGESGVIPVHRLSTQMGLGEVAWGAWGCRSGGFGQVDIITERIRRGWTQKELARRAGVRLETVCRIEAGKHVARREALLKLERALAG